MQPETMADNAPQSTNYPTWGGARPGAGRPRKPKPPTPPSAAERFAALFLDQPDLPVVVDDDDADGDLTPAHSGFLESSSRT